MIPNPLLSILIVDDEMELASLYKEYLETKGYEVVSFTNPLLALEYYKNNTKQFTHVLTDLRMPQRSGIELTCKIRKIDQKVKIFLNTAFEIDDLTKDKGFISAGMEMVIEKPVYLKNLNEYLNLSINQNNTDNMIRENSIQIFKLGFDKKYF